jgi:hypothetical protein
MATRKKSGSEVVTKPVIVRAAQEPRTEVSYIIVSSKEPDDPEYIARKERARAADRAIHRWCHAGTYYESLFTKLLIGNSEALEAAEVLAEVMTALLDKPDQKEGGA